MTLDVSWWFLLLIWRVDVIVKEGSDESGDRNERANLLLM